MNTKYTPGPWAFDKLGDNLTGNGVTIVRCSDWGSSDDIHDESEHNAKLIAAAPELLEALRRSVLAMHNAGPQDWRQEDEYLNYDNALKSAIGLLAGIGFSAFDIDD